jgi:hypothetical protein
VFERERINFPASTTAIEERPLSAAAEFER